MIVLDTHIWVWWVSEPSRLSETYKNYLEANESFGMGVPAISCWEVAMLVAKGRLGFSVPVRDWIEQALAYPGIRLIELSPQIAVDSTQLPGTFHKDPADQMIVATARVLGCPLVTMDGLILQYPHVQLGP